MRWEELSVPEIERLDRDATVLILPCRIGGAARPPPAGRDRHDACARALARRCRAPAQGASWSCRRPGTDSRRTTCGFPAPSRFSAETMIALVEDAVASVVAPRLPPAASSSTGTAATTASSMCSPRSSAIGIYGRARIAALTYFQLARDEIAALRESRPGGMGHACEFETAMMQHLRPDLVDMASASVTYPDPGSPYLTTDLLGASAVRTYHDFGDLSPSGTLGDPSLATRRKGRSSSRPSSAALVRFIEDFASWTDSGGARADERASCRRHRSRVVRHAPRSRLFPAAERRRSWASATRPSAVPRRSPRLTGAKAFTDFRALLALPDLDAVSICLPDREHEAAALAAAAAGKAILLEKPLAHDADTARRIVEAVEPEERA